jgi:tRNA-binding protein
MEISWHDFEKLELRVGTVIDAAILKKARKPAYKLIIDFGALGIKKSSAQLTALYEPDTLINRQVVAVLNFPPKQIADFVSECLVLGVYTAGGDVVLLQPERPVENGNVVG